MIFKVPSKADHSMVLHLWAFQLSVFDQSEKGRSILYPLTLPSKCECKTSQVEPWWFVGIRRQGEEASSDSTAQLCPSLPPRKLCCFCSRCWLLSLSSLRASCSVHDCATCCPSCKVLFCVEGSNPALDCEASGLYQLICKAQTPRFSSYVSLTDSSCLFAVTPSRSLDAESTRRSVPYFSPAGRDGPEKCWFPIGVTVGCGSPPRYVPYKTPPFLILAMLNHGKFLLKIYFQNNALQ